MNDTDQTQPIEPHDIWAAFSLLTRVAIPVDHARAGARAAVASWAYPLVGAILGFAVGCFGVILVWIGTPDGIAAALVLACLALATGGMHEDGLADCADGFGGGVDPVRRLEIMKDSRIGAYGAVALGIALIARWDGVAGVLHAYLPLTLMAVGAASRVPMVLAMYLMPSARERGLSAGVGTPPALSVSIALLSGLIICIIGVGFAGALVLGWALLGSVPVFLLARKLIGGQTGDVLGASQQCAEIAALAAAVAVLG